MIRLWIAMIMAELAKLVIGALGEKKKSNNGKKNKDRD